MFPLVDNALTFPLVDNAIRTDNYASTAWRLCSTNTVNLSRKSWSHAIDPFPLLSSHNAFKGRQNIFLCAHFVSHSTAGDIYINCITRLMLRPIGPSQVVQNTSVGTAGDHCMLASEH